MASYGFIMCCPVIVTGLFEKVVMWFRPCNLPHEGNNRTCHTCVPSLDHKGNWKMSLKMICWCGAPWRLPRQGRSHCSLGSCRHLNCWRCRNRSRSKCSSCQYQWLPVNPVVFGQDVDRGPFRRSLRSCGRSYMHVSQQHS